MSLQTDAHAKNLSEKRKLSLVQWLQDLGANFPDLSPLPRVSVRRTTALSCLPLCLYFALFQHLCETTKWDNTTSSQVLLSEITWCSVAIKCASLCRFSKYGPTYVNNNEKLVSQLLSQRMFLFLHNLDSRDIQKWAVYTRVWQSSFQRHSTVHIVFN